MPSSIFSLSTLGTAAFLANQTEGNNSLIGPMPPILGFLDLNLFGQGLRELLLETPMMGLDVTPLEAATASRSSNRA